jgi:RHS repeat-associated protein
MTGAIMKRALFSLHQVVITVVLLIMAALYSAPPVQAQTFIYVHTDALGSPVAKTNASKAIVSITRYEPYGMTWAGNAPTIGFTGHVNDADTGLTYMQQRYYDPLAGRLLSIDPVTTDFNTGDNFNRFEYANNSPYKFIDPDGRNARILVEIVKSIVKTEAKQAAKAGAKEGAQEGAKATSNAARREVMRKEGIPTSQQPVSQSTNSSGKEYKYETPKPGGGTETKSVQHQTMDRSHLGEKHWEAGSVKTDPRTGEIRETNHGRPKLDNNKSKVDYQ